MERMSWEDICECDDFRGRWVALDECELDEQTGQAREGSVVDSDDSLVVLCERLRENHRKNCQILFCNRSAVG